MVVCNLAKALENTVVSDLIKCINELENLFVTVCVKEMENRFESDLMICVKEVAFALMVFVRGICQAKILGGGPVVWECGCVGC